MMPEINSLLENLVRLGWFVVIFAVAWIYIRSVQNKKDAILKDLKFEELKEKEKLSAMSDDELVNYVNERNKSRRE